jgi:hypothetical protein
MLIAHVTHAEVPFLLALALVAAGAGAVLGVQFVLRALARHRAPRD